jgi:hypothetical protein
MKMLPQPWPVVWQCVYLETQAIEREGQRLDIGGPSGHGFRSRRGVPRRHGGAKVDAHGPQDGGGEGFEPPQAGAHGLQQREKPRRAVTRPIWSRPSPRKNSNLAAQKGVRLGPEDVDLNHIGGV